MDWWEWGPEAFAEAQRRDVPIFLSIGYATCHWCHVMAHECFEDDEVAGLLNQAFVCIKVDREERPDVDAAYMAAIQATNGRGGWPLTAVLDHEKRPWFLGTYIPKHSRGRMGLLELVPVLSDAWRGRRDEVEASAKHILHHAAEPKREPGSPRPEWFQEARDELAKRYDPDHGGFGAPPKFPSPHQIRLLLALGAHGDMKARDMALDTLRTISRGGIHDHVGGGFHRYSTDREWHLPHFEKMLYDQAGLLEAFTDGWVATGDPEFERAARGIVGYVLRDLKHPEGGFFSAEDADSEGEEGTFYIWSRDELRKHLGDSADEFCRAFGVQDEGNFRDEATGAPVAANILHAVGSDAGATQSDALKALRRLRAQRERPLLDDKVLADWNGMMVCAIVRAGVIWNEPAWVQAGADAARFVLERMGPPLRHRWHDGRVDNHTFLDDVAWMGAACCTLFLATGTSSWMNDAQTLAHRLRDEFALDAGAFRMRAADGEALVLERTDAYDGAMPSGNSAALRFLETYARISAEAEWEKLAYGILAAFAHDVERMASAHCAMLLHGWSLLRDAVDVVVTGDDALAVELAAAVTSAAIPGTVLLRKRTASDLVDAAPWAAEFQAERSAAYVCRGRVCEQPVRSVAELNRVLQS